MGYRGGPARWRCHSTCPLRDARFSAFPFHTSTCINGTNMTTATTVEDRLAEDGQRSDVKGMGADCSTSGQGQAAMDSLAGPLPRSPADIHTLPLSRPGSPSEVSGDTSTSHMVHQFPDQAKRVTYIWSPQLESLASDLPSNKDRSKYVHSLTRVMDLLDLGPGVSVDDLQADGGSVVLEEYARDPYELVGGSAASVAATSARRDQPLKARVVRPDLTLGAREVLERYHAEAYLGTLIIRLTRFARAAIPGDAG